VFDDQEIKLTNQEERRSAAAVSGTTDKAKVSNDNFSKSSSKIPRQLCVLRVPSKPLREESLLVARPHQRPRVQAVTYY
jgi:hypothetical protein